MEQNEAQTGVAPEIATEDQTSQNNEQPNTDENLESLKAQKSHWREQAIDPETGKKYKDLYSELKNSKKETKSKKENKTEEKSDNTLMEKAYLRAAGITDSEEVTLALDTASKWGISVDELVDDEDFKVKLERLRTTKSNENATSGVEGSGSQSSNAKQTAEYWITKGEAPTPQDIPDSEVRRKIVRQVYNSQKNNTGNPYYNG